MKDTDKLTLIYENLAPERQQKIADLVITLLLEQAAEEEGLIPDKNKSIASRCASTNPV